MRRATVIVVAAGVLATAYGALESQWVNSPNAGTIPPLNVDTVVRVVDGDTIVTAEAGTVRLIGIDTPETKHPSKGRECYGPEATALAESLLPAGTLVELVTDTELTDRYGRRLAYVYRHQPEMGERGRSVNLVLVLQGAAVAKAYPPNTRLRSEFEKAEAEARATGEGLWGACAR